MSPLQTVEQLELEVLAEIQSAKHRFQLATPEEKSDALRGLRDAVERFSRIVLNGVVPDSVWETAESEGVDAITIPLGTTLREGVRLLVEATLRHTDGNVSAAARMLQINRTTLCKRLRMPKTTE